MTETNNTEQNNPHVCGLPVECWSRVTGYFRPVSAWNKGKQEEFKDRKRFNMDLARNHINSK